MPVWQSRAQLLGILKGLFGGRKNSGTVEGGDVVKINHKGFDAGERAREASCMDIFKTISG
jgi:hypothetical protein